MLADPVEKCPALAVDCGQALREYRITVRRRTTLAW
jgi:hypothetical protein